MSSKGELCQYSAMHAISVCTCACVCEVKVFQVMRLENIFHLEAASQEVVTAAVAEWPAGQILNVT